MSTTDRIKTLELQDNSGSGVVFTLNVGTIETSINKNTTNISETSTRLNSNVTNINTSISNISTRLANNVSAIKSSITDVSSRLKTSVDKLNTSINSVATTAASATATLNSNLRSYIDNNVTVINSSIQNTNTAVSSLQQLVNENKEYIETEIGNVRTDYIAADEATKTEINGTFTNFKNQVQREIDTYTQHLNASWGAPAREIDNGVTFYQVADRVGQDGNAGEKSGLFASMEDNEIVIANNLSGMAEILGLQHDVTNNKITYTLPTKPNQTPDNNLYKQLYKLNDKLDHIAIILYHVIENIYQVNHGAFTELKKPFDIANYVDETIYAANSGLLKSAYTVNILKDASTNKFKSTLANAFDSIFQRKS